MLASLPDVPQNVAMDIATRSKVDLESAATDLSLAIGQLRRQLRSKASPQELNLSQIATLVRLEERVWATTAELARAESMKPQSMSDILKYLEASGLVKRQRHPTDGRQIQFALTDKGLSLRRERKRAKQGWLIDAMSRLSEQEQRQLISAIPVIQKLSDG